MTIGIGNEWDPGDPPETDLGYKYKPKRRLTMASRLGLGRIIGWGKEADQEELHFVLHRLTQIAQERAKRLEGADGHAKVKRTRRAKTVADAGKRIDTNLDPQVAAIQHELGAGA